MKINQDKVPVNLEDAINTLKEGLSTEDYTEFRKETFSPSLLHFGLGMLLRNEWSLWQKDTIIVKWFKEHYGIDHADDISSLILDCLYRDITEKPRQDAALAKRYIAHWKKQTDK